MSYCFLKGCADVKTQKLNEEAIKKLEEYGLLVDKLVGVKIVKCEQGEVFIEGGSPATDIYIALSGKSKVCIDSPDGKQYILCHFISCGIIGDLEMMTNHETVINTVMAVTELVCVRIPIEPNRKELLGNLSFMNFIAGELALKLKQTSEKNISMFFCSVKERLSAYILQTSINGMFRETLTDTAGLLCVSYRHILRCMKSLCEKGTLKKESSGYRISDEKALESLASTLYLI